MYHKTIPIGVYLQRFEFDKIIKLVGLNCLDWVIGKIPVSIKKKKEQQLVISRKDLSKEEVYLLKEDCL